MDRQTTRRATLLAMALFFAQPITIGAWFALIPYVMETQGLDNFQFSLVLLAMNVALLGALQFAGPLTNVFGVRRLCLYIFPIQGVASLLPLIASGLWTFLPGVMVFGATIALMEVPMNVYAGRVEKRSSALIMNRCHGFWSLGMMAGSFIVTTTATVVAPLGAMFAAAIGSTILGALVAISLPKVGEVDDGPPPPRRKISDLPRALWAIGLFMLIATLTEGVMADWSAKYLADRLDVGLREAGIAVTIFAGFMAVGRFSGDLLKMRLGALRLARGSIGLAIVGVCCLSLPLPVFFAYVGFALTGLGAATAYPLGVSAVSALDDRYEAANVAIMSTCALAGILVGPVLIGSISNVSSLSIAFASLLPLLLVALYLARWLR